MNRWTSIAVITLAAAVSSPATAGGRLGPSRSLRLSSLYRRAARSGLKASPREVARTARAIRRIPGAIADLKHRLRAAGRSGKARLALDRYLALRGRDPRALIASLLSPALGRDRNAAAMFIVGGEYRRARRRFDVTDSANGQRIASVYASSRKDVMDAIAAAHGAKEQTTAIPLASRATILRAIASGIAQRRNDLGHLIALEAGKPIADALAEVDRATRSPARSTRAPSRSKAPSPPSGTSRAAASMGKARSMAPST